MKHEENGFQVAVDSQLHGVAVYVDSCGVRRSQRAQWRNRWCR